MTNNQAEGSWSEIKAKIKTKWSKFSDQDLESFKGNLQLVKVRIQKVYGYTKDQVEREFNEFRDSIQKPASPTADSRPSSGLQSKSPFDKDDEQSNPASSADSGRTL